MKNTPPSSGLARLASGAFPSASPQSSPFYEVVKPGFRYAAPILALFFGLMIVCYFLSRHYVYAHDDAFITYKYVDNLCRGRGLVFNTGERVWGFTSPLQTLLLAVPALLRIDLPAASFCLSILWVSLISWMLFRICQRIFPGGGVAFLVALYVLTDGGSYNYLGLESNLLVALQCLFLLLTLSGRHRWAALVAGLSCLARPDSLILVAPIMAMAKPSREPRNWACFLLPGLLWLGFSLSYYGVLLPNTFQAKTGAEPFWQYLQGSFTTLTAVAPASVPARWQSWPRPALALLALCPLLNPKVRAAAGLGYALVVYPWVLVLAYALIGAPLAHSWETYSAFFFFRVGVLVGLFALLGFMTDRTVAHPALRAAATGARAAAVLMVLLLIGFHGRDCFRTLDKHQTAYWFGGRHHDYRAIARWIDGNLPRGETLGLLEVGTIGYYTDMKVIDICGLITKGIKARPPFDYTGFMRRFRPTYMLYPGTVETVVVLGPSLWYEPLQVFTKTYYDTYTMLKRVGAPAP